jgi:aminomethyltransferase
MEGYRALRESAAWIDLSGRGKILARGEDHKRLLHAMTTNHVEQLEPGQGCYAFFLNAQGRILSDVNLFCMPDYFLLDTEPETVQQLYAHLDHYIIADDVTLEDATNQTATLALEGPKAAEILAGLGVPTPSAPHSHSSWGTWTVARVSSTGATGFSIYGPVAGKDELVRQLESSGVAPADAEAARTVRLENGRPRYGEDITEAHLPQETQLLHALHFTKGCYLGQEIVERIRSRGHVNRLLVRLEVHSDEPPATGSRVLADGKQTGEITSGAHSSALGKVVALAYVRSEDARPGKPFVVEGKPAEIAGSTPVAV